jgi:hypothetical protein
LCACGLSVALGACGQDPTDAGEAPGPTDPGPDPGLAPRCTAGSAWQAGVRAFREATAEWSGLGGVAGVRLSAVDFDGDGWADLVVRRAGSAPEPLGPPDACCAADGCAAGTPCERRTWLLRNTTRRGFEDVTHASGLLAPRAGRWGRPGDLYAFADVDGDGDLDAYVGRSDAFDKPLAESSEIVLNQGDGTFALGPEASAVRVASGDVPAGASFVDYDRDGAIDLWIAQNTWNGFPRQDRLLRGDGRGGFTDVTESAGLRTEPWGNVAVINEGRGHSVGWSALACDLDGDGVPELLASSYGRAPNHLWHAVGGGYVNHGVASGYAFDARADWSDNESARCYCKLHPTAADCAGVPPPTKIKCQTDADVFRWDHDVDREPFRLGGNSGSTVCGDVDGDGDMDLLTTEIVHWDVGGSSDPSELCVNTGESPPRCERPGNDATGLVRTHDVPDWNDGDMTGAIFDFDNDARPDVYIGSSDYPGARGLLYHQRADGRFEPVPLADGIDHRRSHGIAVADFDRDGDLDVVLGHSHARCAGADDCYPEPTVRFFENELGASGNWLALRLEGTAANRAAIGARVTVEPEGGGKQIQEVGGGHGHYGIQHDLALSFGLGTACRARVTVRWPDAALATETHDLVAGYRFRLVQGKPPVPDPDP